MINPNSSAILEQTTEDLLNDTFDFSVLLDRLGIGYTAAGIYYQCGDIRHTQGWVLHLSVIVSQAWPLFERVVPVLKEEGVAFKLPMDKVTIDRLLDGMYGYHQVAKIVCIYPESEHQALSLAKRLIPLTREFRGPAIPTDRHLGGAVYTRYGSCNPVLQVMPNGSHVAFIYDAAGNLVQDPYHIPFALPQGVQWPYMEIASPDVPKRASLLNSHIKPVQLIKANVKGSVMKGRYMDRWFTKKYCLIKEGKRYTFSDDHGRDIQDRLAWQFEIHKELEGEAYIPRVHSLFTQDGDAYLTMDFIDGISLDEKITDLADCNSWADLPLPSKLRLLDYLLRIIHMLEVFHAKGYVHRDVSSVNFLVDGKDRLFMIDLELVYSLKERKPYPAFALGTVGFMSPQQMLQEPPMFSDDIYSLGALMTVVFTGLLPIKFEENRFSELAQKLSFFIRDENLCSCIAACMENDRAKRPGLSTVAKQVTAYRNNLDKASKTQTVHEGTDTNKDTVMEILIAALQGIGHERMKDKEGVWFTKIFDTNHAVSNINGSRSNFIGLHEGVAGVYYLLFSLKKIGFDVNDLLQKSLSANMNFIQQRIEHQRDTLPAGLYSGLAGVAVMLAQGISCGFLEDGPDNRNFMRMCLEKEGQGLDFANGAAGIGTAILHCYPYLPEDYRDIKLQQLLNTILDNQDKDGAWEFTSTEDGREMKRFTGLVNGAAGIIGFLLDYASRYKDEQSRQAAVKGLDWLVKQAQKKGEGYLWYTYPGTKEADPWLTHGIAGISLTFIKAYEQLKDPRYKALAEGALRNHAPHVVFRNLSYSWGVSGLADVYLEAARVFQAEEWQQRADWITGSLINQVKMFSDGSGYWVTDNVSNTADLMSGNGGIVYYLARWLSPAGELKFPIFQV